MVARLSPVGALARAADYDRYLSAVFAPAARREALFALIAFNHEIARIPEAVSEPMLGRIRLQWWREVLDAVHAGEPRPPPRGGAAAGRRAPGLRARPPPVRRAAGSAGDRSGGGGPGRSRGRWSATPPATGGSLTQLMVHASGADSGEALEAGRRVGAAWALIGTLRAAPHAAAQGRAHAPGRSPLQGRNRCRRSAGGPGVRALRSRRRAAGGPRRRTARRGAAGPARGTQAMPCRTADRAPRRSLPCSAAPRRVGPARSGVSPLDRCASRRRCWPARS